MGEEDEGTKTGDEGTQQDPPPSGDDGKLTPEQVRSIAAKEKREGKAAGRKELLKQLGLENEEDLTSLVTSHREAQDREKSDAQKAREAADSEKAAAAEERKAARLERYSARAETELIKAGVPSNIAERTVRLMELEYDGTDELPQRDDIIEAVQALKKDTPQLFSSEGSSGDQEQGNPDSDTGNPPKTPSGKEPTAKEKAAARLKRMHPEGQQAMTSYDDLVKK